MIEKVTKLSTVSNSGYMWSPKQCLEHALEELESGETKATKALVILLDDSRLEDGQPGRRFDLVYYQAKMSGLEIAGLCDAIQYRVAKRRCAE